MSRSAHISEPRWGDDPYEEERFEFAQLVMWVVAFAFVCMVLGFWYWLVSTKAAGHIRREQRLILMTGGEHGCEHDAADHAHHA